MACRIDYIDKQPLSETEKERLFSIHVNIFKQAKESKAFREINNRLQTIKDRYADATAFVGKVNQEKEARITVLNSIGGGNAVLNVNVLSLAFSTQMELFIDNKINELQGLGELKIICK